jgi:predicted esterase YcpF (UPF0227 family)
MKNLLYIHGFGGSGNGNTAKQLKEMLTEHDINVISPSFDNTPTAEALRKNIELANSLRCDIVIGSSYGGFVAMASNIGVKFLINPCMLPSIEIPKISDMTADDAALIAIAENNIHPDLEDKDFTFAVFAKNDELIQYKPLFDKMYRANNSAWISGGHEVSSTVIKNEVVPFLIDKLSVAEKRAKVYEYLPFPPGLFEDEM